MIRLLFLILLVVCVSCHSEISPRDKAVYKAIGQFSKTLKSKRFRSVGVGGGLDHEVKKYNHITLVLMTEEKIPDLETARLEYIEVTSAFLCYLNSQEQIQDYLAVTPLTIDNIEVGILVRGAVANDFVSISNCGNKIYYSIKETDDEYSPWIDIHEETYEEALAIIAQRQECP